VFATLASAPGSYPWSRGQFFLETEAWLAWHKKPERQERESIRSWRLCIPRRIAVIEPGAGYRVCFF